MLVIFFVLSTRNTCASHYPFPLEDLFGVPGIPFFQISCLDSAWLHRVPKYESVKVSFDL